MKLQIIDKETNKPIDFKITAGLMQNLETKKDDLIDITIERFDDGVPIGIMDVMYGQEPGLDTLEINLYDPEKYEIKEIK